MTASVLSALREYASQYALSSTISSAVAFLRSLQGADGSWEGDPITGAGAYLIDGGRAGGGSGAGEGVAPPTGFDGGVLIGAIASAARQDAKFGKFLLRAVGGLGPVGLAAVGIVLGMLIAYMVLSAITGREELRLNVIELASANPLANSFPEDNCRVMAVLVKGVTFGWALCTYTCKSSGNFHPRYLPVEVACPQPVPCAPGLPPDMAPAVERIPLVTPIDPSAATCIFR